MNEATPGFGQKLAAKAPLDVGNIASGTELREESESEVNNLQKPPKPTQKSFLNW